MHRFPGRLPLLVIALTVWASAACGGDSAQVDEQPTATATEAAAQAESVEPSATPTQAAADPSPTLEPEPTETATTTPAVTPTLATAPTLAPIATETPVAEQAVIGACGGATISYFPWETEIPNNIDQWNRIIGAANEITTSWNAFVAASENVLDYDAVVGNEAVISAATTLTSTIDTQYPVIAEEAADSESLFGPLAQSELTSADTIRELAQLTITAAGGDIDAWNTSIDQWSLVSTAIEGATSVHDIACQYWQSVSS